MMHLGGMDFVRALVGLLLLEGAAYVFFPKVIQSFAMNILNDAPIPRLRSFGLFFIVLACIIWWIASHAD